MGNGGITLPSRLRVWGASWAPQRGSGRSPGRQRIFGISEIHRTLLVERTFTEWCAKPRKRHVRMKECVFVEIYYENFWPTPKNFRQSKNFRLLQQLGPQAPPAIRLWCRKACTLVFLINAWPSVSAQRTAMYSGRSVVGPMCSFTILTSSLPRREFLSSTSSNCSDSIVRVWLTTDKQFVTSVHDRCKYVDVSFDVV